MVGPTKRNPRRRRSADSDFDSAVEAGTSAQVALAGRTGAGRGSRRARYSAKVPYSAATARYATALPIVASILARLRTMPASASSLVLSASS